jgi:hypothetical protein
MTPQTFTISNITPSQIAGLEADLAKDGAFLAATGPNQMHITGHGIVANAEYDPIALTLTVTVFDKPFIISMGRIESMLKAALG